MLELSNQHFSGILLNPEHALQVELFLTKTEDPPV